MVSVQKRRIGAWFFDKVYSGRTKAVLSFCLSRCINEYANQLGFFEPIKEVHVQEQAFDEALHALAFTDVDLDIMKITCPKDLIVLLIKAKGTETAHETLHHILEEHYEAQGKSRKERILLCNDLTHAVLNMGLYQYKKRFVNKLLIARYGILYVEIVMTDAKAVIEHADEIMEKVRTGEARGKNPLWTLGEQ